MSLRKSGNRVNTNSCFLCQHYRCLLQLRMNPVRSNLGQRPHHKTSVMGTRMGQGQRIRRHHGLSNCDQVEIKCSGAIAFVPDTAELPLDFLQYGQDVYR